jgi:hypothetical protein
MKLNTLLKTIFVFILFTFSMMLKAQEQEGKTYIITDNGSVQNIQPYIDALNSSNMKNHRLKNTRNTIIFTTGVTVKLFSAAEMIANGRTINLNDYPDSFDSNRDEPTFSLGSNNFIMEMHHVTSKHR